MRTDIAVNAAKWEWLTSLLGDADSRQVLEDIVQYRLTGDSSHMQNYRYRPEEQYFEDFLGLGADEVFVDAGGFTGDTSEEFCKRIPNYRAIYLFEPSKANIIHAQIRLAGRNNIELIELGLSSSTGTLRFDPDSGSASAVSNHGTIQINVTTLDHHIRKPVSFIKMDLEGWELEALKGARNHILQDHPKLAISVYHSPSDFWRIPEFVLGVRADYDVFLRHYTEGWSETVMFFVPRSAGSN